MTGKLLPYLGFHCFFHHSYTFETDWKEAKALAVNVREELSPKTAKGAESLRDLGYPWEKRRLVVDESVLLNTIFTGIDINEIAMHKEVLQWARF